MEWNFSFYGPVYFWQNFDFRFL